MAEGSAVASSQVDLDDKDTVVGMLKLASELEHSLCVQYLYAAFTLRQGGDTGLTASQSAVNEQWFQQITRIAIQEMYHLLLASNLLTAVGAAPNLWRPPFPQPPGRYSDIGLPSTLAPFGRATLTRFLCWEKPDQEGWWDTTCPSCADADRSRLGMAATVEPPPFGTIGQLYADIRQALLANPGWIDPEAASRQVTSALVPFRPTVSPILKAEQAAAYIDIIVIEGEGQADWDSSSHFAYFHQILAQLPTKGGTDPAWPTVENPVYDGAGNRPGTTLIDDPGVQPVGVACNDLYTLLVLVLSRLFNPNGESAAERQSLANVSMALMPIAIEPLSRLLTRMPAGTQHPGLYAGPGFELPEAMEAPTGPKDDVFAQLYARLRDVTSRCRILSLGDTAPIGAPALVQLGTVAARLEKLLPLLQVDGTAGARR